MVKLSLAGWLALVHRQGLPDQAGSALFLPAMQ